jgi:hypothetical protein
MILRGELLTGCKDAVGHGLWLEWFRSNEAYCGFSEDTAERYNLLYTFRDRLN